MFDITHANLQKEEIQFKAVGLSELYDNLLLNWATGTGKTYAVLQIISDWILRNGRIPKTYIILKEIAHHNNWQEEFKKHSKERTLEGVRFFCYASLQKFADTKCDILILDEAHALSEMREDYLKTIECDKIISLSATIKSEIVARIRNYKAPFYNYHIGLQDAIDKGILPKPDIYVAYTELDKTKKEYSWVSPKAKKGVETLVTAHTYYKKLQSKIDFWEKMFKEKGHLWAENKWVSLMGERKRFIASCKTDAASYLLQNLADKKYICFCGSVAQADELGAQYQVHSKMHRGVIDRTIQWFNDGQISHIYAVNMLRESMNLKDIEAAVIVQLDNQQGSFEQMTGRSLRSLAPEVYILVLKGTKDEDYFDKATRGISSQYISEYTWPEPPNLLTL